MESEKSAISKKFERGWRVLTRPDDYSAIERMETFDLLFDVDLIKNLKDRFPDLSKKEVANILSGFYHHQGFEIPPNLERHPQDN